MRKTRLNNSHRDALRGLARSLVEKSDPNNEAFVKAYDAMKKAFLEAYNKLIPVKEREVLNKHGYMLHKKEVQVLIVSEREYYKLDLEEPTQLPAESYPTFSWDDKDPYVKAFVDAHNAMTKTKEARRNSIETRCGEYCKLISFAKYFEDVAAVWPEARELESRICVGQNTAIVCLSDQTIKNIKEDMKRRVGHAKEAA